jgi:hypothetical protein
MISCRFLVASVVLVLLQRVAGLNILIPGGTGPLGKIVSSKLSSHDVTILSRNAFLAAAPSRVTEDFGWVGRGFLNSNAHIRLRDWDGGDLLDIVGQDWIGWQEDALKSADVVINLVGGFTQQRTMATERIVRESLQFNPNALQITVAPVDEDIKAVSPKASAPAKMNRIQACEELVKSNCRSFKCLRIEANDLERSCETIIKAALSVRKMTRRLNDKMLANLFFAMNRRKSKDHFFRCQNLIQFNIHTNLKLTDVSCHLSYLFCLAVCWKWKPLYDIPSRLPP